jgi:hypothetical protein
MEKVYKEGDDYLIVDKPEQNYCSVHLIDGKYSGVIYSYGKVGVPAERSKTESKLSFVFKIENPFTFTEQELRADPEFKNTIGDVLRDIIIGGIEKKNEYARKNPNSDIKDTDTK